MMTTNPVMNNDEHQHPPRQKKVKREEPVVPEAGEQEEEDEEDDINTTYVVVTETYPTTYGKNRGTTYDRGQMIALTKVEVTKDYDTYEDAVEQGKVMRDAASRWFHDYEYRDGANNNADGEETNDHNPPWDSAELKNYDNDEEMRIRIMTTMDYDDFAYENQLFLEDQEREQRRAQKIDQRS
mmetsp:Transcript_30299/g.50076  ORF Transcript_30299/g.50076 Transcript_30299/m.50076 type:complete len:183 (+) Transcript_30299:87-635(+)